VAGRQQSDPALVAQIEELRGKVRAYEAPNPLPTAPTRVEPPSGVVQLGKKTAGGIVPIPAKSGVARGGAHQERNEEFLMAQEGE